MASWKRQSWGLAAAIALSTLAMPAWAEPPAHQLTGITVLLNPGHGGPETGAAGPTGAWAKDVSLTVSLLLRDELLQRGAKVVMTRETDLDVSLTDRQQLIAQVEPAIALTIHYTTVEEDGDAEGSQGVRSYWFHPQSQGAAVFLHHYLVERLGRVAGGVFWNNLALTRPSEAPAVVLELGFMTHPEEFEWIIDEEAQRTLAQVLADGIETWLQGEPDEEILEAAGLEVNAADANFVETILRDRNDSVPVCSLNPCMAPYLPRNGRVLGGR